MINIIEKRTMKLSKIKSLNKKAALELSIGTIVILVLAMSMLILGLVLVRTIFTGAKYNVETMNDKVRDQINAYLLKIKKDFYIWRRIKRLFSKERHMVLHLEFRI